MLEPQLNTDMIRYVQLKDTHKKLTDNDEMNIDVKYTALESIKNELIEIELNVMRFIKSQNGESQSFSDNKDS